MLSQFFDLPKQALPPIPEKVLIFSGTVKASRRNVVQMDAPVG
jgi:hypothetical protein